MSDDQDALRRAVVLAHRDYRDYRDLERMEHRALKHQDHVAAPSPGSPADALATAQYALQQWSALTESRGAKGEDCPGDEEAEEEEAEEDPEDDSNRRGAQQDAQNGNKRLIMWSVLSLQYAKLLIILGVVLPISKVIAPQLTPQSFQAFYLFLYMGSLWFMMYMYITTAWRHRVKVTVERRTCNKWKGVRYRVKRLEQAQAEKTVRYGSLYMRLGANAFGIGSMVYCGLEIAHELERYLRAPGPGCLVQDSAEQAELERASVAILLPACRAALTLMQMHFMLFSDRAAEVRKSPCAARIGLAHMIATNVCEWLSVVVDETRHEIAELGSGGWILADHGDLDGLAGNSTGSSTNATSEDQICAPPTGNDVIGNLLQSAGPFLFPCTIEYSLICAVILLEMWKHAGQAENDTSSTSTASSRVDLSSDSRSSRVQQDPDDIKTAAMSTITASSVPWRTAHHLSVDLTHSQHGLFLGVIQCVVTIMALVLFFALGESASLQRTTHAVMAYLELGLHGVLLFAVGLAATSMRKLKFDNVPCYPLPLDMFLLLVAQTGAYIYSVFSLVGSYLLLYQEDPTGRVTEIAVRSLVVEGLATLHVCSQTHFILRAWHMRCVGERQWAAKPGRQHVTFLVFGNLSLWLVDTFCKNRAQYRPLHMQLFGVWPWTVLTHVSMPLTIFFHFHSSICLFEIWKNTYKFRPD